MKASGRFQGSVMISGIVARVHTKDELTPRESVTVNVKLAGGLNWAVVATPTITAEASAGHQFSGFGLSVRRTKPMGSAPPVIDQVYGGAPPVAPSGI